MSSDSSLSHHAAYQTDFRYKLLESLSSLGLHATDRQRLALINRANSLRMKISNFYDIQKLYCPGAFMIVSRANDNNSPPNATEEVGRLKLCLPSSIKTQLGCTPELRELEWELRYAQAHDALDAIRAGLHLRVSVFRYKDRFERGQRALTRSMGNISRVQTQIDGATHRYRTARTALSALARFLPKDGSWRKELQELKAEDVRGLGVADIDNTTEGRRTISWIWRTIGVNDNEEADSGLHDSLRLEWCKSRARALRWTEEVLLLKEEMRRVLAFLRWQAEWWEGKVRDNNGTHDIMVEGVNAYALRQADIRIRLAASFASKWACVPDYLKLYNPLDPHEMPPANSQYRPQQS